MRFSRSALWAALVAATALAGAGIAAGEDAPSRNLVHAYARSDFARLARIGRGESARGLAIHLADHRAVYVRAAIAAAPSAEDAWQLLGDLADLAAKADRQVGPAAARVAVEIAQSLTSTRVAELEITPAELRARSHAWAEVSQRAGLWPDVRVHALETSYLLARALPAPDRAGVAVDLAAITGDRDPEVRRAALELYPQPLDQEARERASEVLRADTDPVVALVAGQVVCGGIAIGDAAAPIVADVGDAGLDRIRNLIGNTQLPLAARLEASYCLAANGSKDDVAALRQLASSVPRFAAKEARAILQKASP